MKGKFKKGQKVQKFKRCLTKYDDSDNSTLTFNISGIEEKLVIIYTFNKACVNEGKFKFKFMF